jgi:hypothetical protein
MALKAVVFWKLEKALHITTEGAEPGQDKKPGFKTGEPVPIGIALDLFVENPSLIISNPADMFIWQGSRIGNHRFQANYDIVFQCRFPMEDPLRPTVTKAELCCAQELAFNRWQISAACSQEDRRCAFPFDGGTGSCERAKNLGTKNLGRDCTGLDSFLLKHTPSTCITIRRTRNLVSSTITSVIGLRALIR